MGVHALLYTLPIFILQPRLSIIVYFIKGLGDDPQGPTGDRVLCPSCGSFYQGCHVCEVMDDALCPSCGCLYQGYHDCEVMDNTLCPFCGCLYQGHHDCEEMDDCKNDNGKNNLS